MFTAVCCSLIIVCLQVLNEYIDRLSRGKMLFQQRVEFCTVAGEDISTIKAVLPASGNLGPLFHAFGLISEAESDHHTTSPGLLDLHAVQPVCFKLLLCLSIMPVPQTGRCQPELDDAGCVHW